MDRLIQNQRDFFASQKTKDVNFRLTYLKKLREAIIKNEAAIIKALHDDFKKGEFETLGSEIGVVISELNTFIRKVKRWSKPVNVMPSLLNFPSKDKIYRDPYGTVLIISPWNYPFNLAMIPLAGAIAAGNTVVLKPSEYSPHTSAILKKILGEVFPEDYVAVVEGDASVARRLLQYKWDYVFFTGSTHIGKLVYQAAAKFLTPVTLELGGKSPAIVDKTANLKIAARRIVWGKFLNAGQTCIAPDYVMVHKSVSARFLEHLIEEIKRQYGTEPSKSGEYARIINKLNFDRLQAMISEDVLYYGGDCDKDDLYISPTVLLEPELDSPSMQGEIFGPVLPVITYRTDEEVEKVLMRYPNPLAFYVFTSDKKMSRHYIAKYSFGGGVINDTIIHFVNNRLPFGGVGDSGLGRYHGKYSFLTFTREKPIVTRGTWLDIPVRYLPATPLKRKLVNFFLTGRLK